MNAAEFADLVTFVIANLGILHWQVAQNQELWGIRVKLRLTATEIQKQKPG